MKLSLIVHFRHKAFMNNAMKALIQINRYINVKTNRNLYF